MTGNASVAIAAAAGLDRRLSLPCLSLLLTHSSEPDWLEFEEKQDERRRLDLSDLAESHTHTHCWCVSQIKKSL